MKKKFLLTLLALVCALCCAFGLAACDNGGDSNQVTGTLKSNPEHVVLVKINDIPLGDMVNTLSTSSLDKEKETTINVLLDRFYEIGTLKMSINGTEMALTKHATDNNIYTCKYTPTADFEITFSGEAKPKTTTIMFNTIDWQPCYDYYSGQDDATAKGDALKALIQNNVRIKLLVNDVEKAPYNGMKLISFESALSTNSAVTINMKDKVEIQLYTDSNELILSTAVILVNYNGPAEESSLSSDNKNYTAKIDEVIDTVTITICPHISRFENN